MGCFFDYFVLSNGITLLLSLPLSTGLKIAYFLICLELRFITGRAGLFSKIIAKILAL